MANPTVRQPYLQRDVIETFAGEEYLHIPGLRCPIPQRPRQDLNWRISLTTSTLFQAPRPFQTPIIPNPTIARSTFYAADAIINGAIFVVKPFAQTDWPLPVRRVRQTPGWNLNTTALTTFVGDIFGATLGGPRYFLDVPEFPHANLLNTTLAAEVVVAAPFRPVAWPNPPQVKRADGWTIGSTIRQAPAAPVVKPFAQTEWPNPAKKLRPFGLSFWTISATIRIPAAPVVPPEDVGFATTARLDGPVYFQNRQYQEPILNLLASTLKPGQVKSFIKIDHRWPVRQQPALVRNLLTSVPFVPPAPTRKLDWPNPAQKLQPRQAWQHELNLPWIMSLPKPFKKTDWPNPLLPLNNAEYAISLQSPIWFLRDIQTVHNVAPRGWTDPNNRYNTTAEQRSNTPSGARGNVQ